MSACTFWITRKNRACKMQAKTGALFCAEHLTASSSSTTEVAKAAEEDERIPCPLDPAHSVYKSKLTKHLKKCNARNPTVLPAYHQVDCNLHKDKETVDAKKSASTTTVPSAAEIAKKVLEKSKTLLPDPIKTRFTDATFASISETEKHRLQQSALAQKILATVQPDCPLAFIEMGAGKGGLSAYLWEEHIRDDEELRKRSRFLLIDRSNSRCKKDAKMKHEGAQVERIFIDIKDLRLAALIEEKCQPGTQCFFISKHLCGAATCLTINALRALTAEAPEMKITLAVALCCHQCCAWNAYPNRPFLEQNELARTEEEFKKLKAMTSWAVCGRIKEEFEWENYRGSDEDKVAYEEVDESVVEDEEVLVQDSFSEKSISEPLLKKSKIDPDNSKREIGRLAKRLLDFGRLLALKEAGFEAGELGHYIPEEVTLENAVLFTRKQ